MKNVFSLPLNDEKVGSYARNITYVINIDNVLCFKRKLITASREGLRSAEYKDRVYFSFVAPAPLPEKVA